MSIFLQIKPKIYINWDWDIIIPALSTSWDNVTGIPEVTAQEKYLITLENLSECKEIRRVAIELSRVECAAGELLHELSLNELILFGKQVCSSHKAGECKCDVNVFNHYDFQLINSHSCIHRLGFGIGLDGIQYSIEGDINGVPKTITFAKDRQAFVNTIKAWFPTVSEGWEMPKFTPMMMQLDGN